MNIEEALWVITQALTPPPGDEIYAPVVARMLRFEASAYITGIMDTFAVAPPPVPVPIDTVAGIIAKGEKHLSQKTT